MNTRCYTREESIDKILEGVEIIYKMVGSTLGPEGKTTIISALSKNSIINTKDGYTVAKNIVLSDKLQNIGAQLVKIASMEQNSKCGDGTTTVVVLARNLLKHSQKYLNSEISPYFLNIGIKKAISLAIEELRQYIIPIKSKKDIRNVATISANGDEQIGELVAMGVDKAGKDGSVSIEEARSVNTTLEVIEGFQFDSGYISTSFINDERLNLVKFENPYLLITDEKISTVDQIMEVLSFVAREGKPLVIVAEEVKDQALAALITNSIRSKVGQGGLKIVACKAPRYGEERRNILKDLALSTGAHFISLERGINLKSFKPEMLGKSKSIEVRKDLSIVAGGAGDYEQIEKKIDELKEQIRQSKGNDVATQERITRLSSGVAVIYVGGSTEIEVVEKRHRIEDALESVRSALSEGIMIGGGISYLKASKYLESYLIENKTKMSEEEICGFEVVIKTLKEPLKKIIENKRISYDVVELKLQQGCKNKNFGLNVRTNEYCDLYEYGVVEPFKVVRSALENSVSVACSILGSNCVVVEEE